MPSSGGKTSALRSEEHTSELQSNDNLVCRLLLEKKKLPQRPDPVRGGRRGAPGGLARPSPRRAAAPDGGRSRRGRHDASFFLMLPRPPTSPLFPSPPLFR